MTGVLRTIQGRLSFVAFILLLGGCQRLGVAPTLHVQPVQAVPKPNAMIERGLWGEAPELTLRARRVEGGFETGRPVQLRAVHDGRALSILAAWPDPSETVMYRRWIWSEAEEAYHLQEFPADALELHWPLDGGKPPDWTQGEGGTLDVWRWRADWTDRSGWADDGRLKVEVVAMDADKTDAAHELYPLAGGKKMAALRWIADSGRPGTRATGRPPRHQGASLPGAWGEEARGSAADVEARGLYNRLPLGRPNHIFVKEGEYLRDNAWRQPGFDDETVGYWFVEFYRRLRTDYPEEDYQIGERGNWLRLEIVDNEGGGARYRTEPFRLVLK